jgi:putative addiction module component (TIGR02574 family)
MTKDELLEAARRLPPAERARLVEGILHTLDEPDPAIEAAWTEEIERRIDDLDLGRMKARPWKDVKGRLGL